MARTKMSKGRKESGDETAVRKRILEAAFRAFMKSGYAAASTLEIATRARVSKRELYALVGNKQKMLIASSASARSGWKCQLTCLSRATARLVLSTERRVSRKRGSPLPVA